MREILIIAIIIFNSSCLLAQKYDTDRFFVNYDLSYGIMPAKITGIHEENGKAPRWIDTAGLAHTFVVHVGINVPFYRTKNWSIGGKLGVGFGAIGSLHAAEGLESLAFDFPAFLYFRYYKDPVDFSFLVGYKYTYTALPYQLPIAAIQYNITETASIRLYGSLKRYSYYYLFTDGREVPAISIGEFGLCLTLGMGNHK